MADLYLFIATKGFKETIEAAIPNSLVVDPVPGSFGTKDK